MIIWDGYEFGGLYPTLGVFFFLLSTIPYSIVLSWLRIRTGSIWPTVLAHASINAVAGGVIGYMLSEGNPYLGAPLGIIGLLPWFIFAGWLIYTHRLQPASSRNIRKDRTIPTYVALTKMKAPITICTCGACPRF
ncbi:hypothetical protein KDK_80090 [Dictyobacter kobayashii]|uniref:CAAX prenyl protease 2/Lysostaphin resistance protein A-like domain-containing protein n=1 Tax=Dictyobacter kobayashii TaxID=2014872 RepID=A0A402AYM4_9CHLR|nr:CPBP family intramembrane glutamic endopeptidase [Dictyobacter kobayashii]GCE24209.1 hypothetical protein KDK_80090 [Dictyobacter kobayashii]